MNKVIEEYIETMKEIQSCILEFIENDDDNAESFKCKLLFLIDQGQLINQYELKIFFHILLQIANHHHHCLNFFQKIEQILLYCKQILKQIFTNFEMFLFFKSNKKILLFLIEENIMIFDNIIVSYMLNCKNPGKYFNYFYPEIQKFTPTLFKKFSRLFCIYSEINDHIKLRKIGENESYICALIRNDSVEEFIAYVNRSHMSLVTTRINPSQYETNLFLKNKNLTIIEYAVFFGSIQIIKYLLFNNIRLTPSIWIYAIHSNCPDVIHLFETGIEYFAVTDEYLEEKNQKQLFIKCFNESIKCHHNNIANYIINVLVNINDFNDNLFNKILISNYNFTFIQLNNFYLFDYFFYFIQYDYFMIVDFILNNHRIRDDFENYSQYLKKSTNEIIQLFLKRITWPINYFTFVNFKKIKQIEIPSSVKCIGKGSFNNCVSLQKISIPNSIESIENNAFYNCMSLEEIEIPSSVKSIGNYAFYKCSSLKQINIPSSVDVIGYFTFGYCSSLIKINIPSSVTMINDYAFKGCSSLKDFIIPFSVKSIGFCAFYNCTSITQVSIPSSVISINSCAFNKCSSLEQISIPFYLPFFRYHEFDGCTSLKYISIPFSVKMINDGAFIDCKSLFEIFIPSSVLTICHNAFKNCKSLEKVEFEFGSSLKTIEGFAFNKCTSLKEITIPSSVINIGEYTFFQCHSLTNIFFETPTLLNSLEEGIFSECFSLSNISIPPTTKIIGKESFKLCMSITQLDIPPSVIKIDHFAFFGCLSLMQISIPYPVDPLKLGLESNTNITIYETINNKKCNIF